MSDSERCGGGARRFNLVFFALLLSALAATALFNYRLNPYGYFNGWPLAIDRGESDRVFSSLRYFKAYDVARYAPEHLILGSSRAGGGITHVAPYVDGLRSYNIALPGMTPYEVLRYLQHSHNLRPLKGALIGLDLFTFNRHDQFYRPGYSEERLLSGLGEGFAQGQLFTARVRDLTIALTSEDALREAIKTARNPPRQTDGGMRLNDDGSWGRAQVEVDNSKAYSHFIKQEDHYLGKGWVGNRSRAFALYGHDSRLQYYREVLRYAHQQRIDLRLFTSPTHARMLVLMNEVGLWECFEQWKRELWQINYETALELGRVPFALWDFAGVDQWTTAPLSESVIPRDFVDSSHYSIVLGARVLERVYRDSPEAAEFGRRIDSSNGLEQHLRVVRASLDDYMRDNPAQTQALRERVATFWNAEKGYPDIGSCRPR